MLIGFLRGRLSSRAPEPLAFGDFAPAEGPDDRDRYLDRMEREAELHEQRLQWLMDSRRVFARDRRHSDR